MSAQTNIEPLAYSIPDAARASGISRSRLYELAKSGDLKIIKIKTRSLIAVDDLRALLKRFRDGSDAAA